MSRPASAAFLGLLVVIWVGLPLLPDPHLSMAFLFQGLAALAVLAAACGLWRAGTLTLGPPWWAAALALASLALAASTEPERFPRVERWWTAQIGVAHALLFLSTLALVPARAASGAPAQDDAAATTWRRGLLVALLLLLLAQAAAMVPQLRAGERPAGSLGNPNILGAALAAAALGLAGLCAFRRLALLPLSGVLLLILATRSRGALAATGAVLLAFVARRRPRAALLVVLGLVLVFVVPNPLRERVLTLRSDHHFSRLFFWEVALGHIAEAPLGIGPGMNRHVFPARAWNEEHPWLLHQRHGVGLTHNLLLTLTLEWGWLAGGAALGLLAWSARRLLRRHALDDLGLGAALGAGVLLLEAQVDGVEQNPLACSLLLVLTAGALGRAAGPLRGPAVPRRLVAGFLGAAAVALLALAVERGRRDLALSGARQAVAAHATAGAAGADAAQLFQLADRALTHAEAIAPDSAEVHLQRFLLLEQQLTAALALPDPDITGLAPTCPLAWEALGRAQALDPADPWLWRCAARFSIRLYRRAGQQPEQLDVYFASMHELLARDPLDVAARWEVAQEAQRAGRRALMEQQARELLRLEPDDALAWYALGVFRELAGELEGAAYALQRAGEALLNARIKAGIDHPGSRAYYQRILEKVDLGSVRAALAGVRRRLYG